MKSKYEIRSGNIVRLYVEFSMDELMKQIENDNGYDNVGKMLRSYIAKECADAFVKERLRDVLKAMKPEEIANLATLQTIRDIKNY